MLTPEQKQNLKPGDPIVIKTTFMRADEDGDIHFKAPAFNSLYNKAFISYEHVSLPSEHGTLVPTTKYDPTRLFKEGDWVRIVKHQGRKFNAAPPAFQLGKTYRVSEDENTEHCYVMLQSCDLHYAHPVAFLELVTPVDEREPFGVRYSPDRDCAEVYHRRYKNTVAAFYCKCGITREQAEEHAEAECARLNAEWRKKVGTEVPCSEDGKEGNND